MTQYPALYKLLGILLFAVITVMGYRHSLQAQYLKFQNAYHTDTALRQTIEEMKMDSSKKDVYFAQFTQTQTIYNNAMTAFPNNIYAALENVRKAGANAHLQFPSTLPGTPINKGFYSEVPVDFTVLGTYQNIINFMQTTSTGNGPVFIWKSWTLSQPSQPKTTVLNEKPNANLLQMNVNAIFFTKP